MLAAGTGLPNSYGSMVAESVAVVDKAAVHRMAVASTVTMLIADFGAGADAGIGAGVEAVIANRSSPENVVVTAGVGEAVVWWSSSVAVAGRPVVWAAAAAIFVVAFEARTEIAGCTAGRTAH